MANMYIMLRYNISIQITSPVEEIKASAKQVQVEPLVSITLLAKMYLIELVTVRLKVMLTVGQGMGDCFEIFYCKLACITSIVGQRGLTNLSMWCFFLKNNYDHFEDKNIHHIKLDNFVYDIFIRSSCQRHLGWSIQTHQVVKDSCHFILFKYNFLRLLTHQCKLKNNQCN